MNKVHINTEDKRILSAIFKDYRAVLFGSRVLGTHQPFSDLDVCLKSDRKIAVAEIASLREKLSASNLAFKVDIVIYDEIPPSFQQIIDKQGVYLHNPGK